MELGPLGITINSIAPGAIETPINSALLNDPVKLRSLVGQIPLARLGKPADVAALADSGVVATLLPAAQQMPMPVMTIRLCTKKTL